MEKEILKSQQSLVTHIEKSSVPSNTPLTAEVSLRVVNYEIFNNDYCVCFPFLFPFLFCSFISVLFVCLWNCETNKKVFHFEVTQYGVSQIVKKRFKELSEFHKVVCQSLVMTYLFLSLPHFFSFHLFVLTPQSGFSIDGPPKKAVKSSLKHDFLVERMADISKYFTRLERVKDARRNPKFIVFFELEALEEKKVWSDGGGFFNCSF
jgi:hypothetical protein